VKLFLKHPVQNARTQKGILHCRHVRAGQLLRKYIAAGYLLYSPAGTEESHETYLSEYKVN
jgi:hypothetical protein